MVIIIFIKSFVDEETITRHLENKISKFPIYLGNSEFAGNFRLIKILDTKEMLNMPSAEVDSFILESDIKKIEFITVGFYNANSRYFFFTPQ